MMTDFSDIGTRLKTHGAAVWLKHGRVRLTLPLTHFLISPLSAQFIAAYPRSGSTWLRTMLVNVLCPESNSDPELFNRIIPGASVTRVPRAYRAPEPRIISTHSAYRRSIRRAVYLVRDGRDSVTSLFRYTTNRAGTKMDFGTWFSYYMKGYYGPRWDQNVVSWLVRGKEALGDRLLIVRFEDLRADPVGELGKVCSFLDIGYAEDRLVHAIEAASIDKMRKWEEHYKGRIKDSNASFYRGGNMGQWRDMFTREQEREFMGKSKTALTLCGYTRESSQAR